MSRAWSPDVRLLPKKIQKDDYEQLVDEVAGFIYDSFCQLQKIKSKLVSSTRIEPLLTTTHGNLLPDRTGSDG